MGFYERSDARVKKGNKDITCDVTIRNPSIAWICIFQNKNFSYWILFLHILLQSITLWMIKYLWLSGRKKDTFGAEVLLFYICVFMQYIYVQIFTSLLTYNFRAMPFCLNLQSSRAEGCLTVHLPHEIKWNANLMQKGNFIDVFLARHV